MQIRLLDFYDAKGAVEAALGAAGVSGLAFAAAKVNHLRVGQSASISLNNEVIGYLGRINDEIARTYKFRQPVYVAELNLSSAMNTSMNSATYRPLAKFPAVIRDVSFIVGRTTSFADVHQAIVEQDYQLCSNVIFVDIYEGKGLTEDERSITIRMEYRSDERTLIEDEVESLHKQIVSRTEQKLGIKTRV
jgi:phenylalanyl-tRNA synthetase beta chain